MKKPDLSKMTTPALVARFRRLVLDQEIFLLSLDTKRYSQLFYQVNDITNELKTRDGDGRRGLLAFFDHESPHLRFTTACSCEDLSPAKAREVLRQIRETRITPYALHAGMSLWMLERKDRGEI